MKLQIQFSRRHLAFSPVGGHCPDSLDPTHISFGSEPGYLNSSKPSTSLRRSDFAIIFVASRLTNELIVMQPCMKRFSGTAEHSKQRLDMIGHEAIRVQSDLYSADTR